MAQLDQNYYEQVARYYAETLLQMESANEYLRDAMILITNITTTNYVGGEDAAIDVTLNLLPSMNSAYNGFTNLIASNSSLLVAVRAINDYVQTNATGAERAAASLQSNKNQADISYNGDVLAYYINLIDWQGTTAVYSSSDGDDTAVPAQWIYLSKAAGYTVALWDGYAAAALKYGW